MEDLAVEVEEGALAAQFLQPGVGGLIEGVELVERLDQEGAAAARRVEDTERLQRVLPRFPEADEGLALRFVESGQVVSVGVGERFAGGAGGLRDEYTRTIAPACALDAETLNLERTLSDLVNQAYALTPAEIALMWKTAPPRMPIPPPTR